MRLINRFDFRDNNFLNDLSSLREFKDIENESIKNEVSEILSNIKFYGDAALLSYTKKFDCFDPISANQLEITKEQCHAALDDLPESKRKALELAALRIKNYHEHQFDKNWTYSDEDGVMLGQKVTPIHRVGLYVPGGKASYPSSVLMNAIPAKIAGVKELIMVSPTPNGKTNSIVLAAAALSGVDRVFAIGGAQSIGALTYGTNTVPKVDKIVGPGNAYVSSAKRHVFGIVGIDMIAGPSEILIISDGKVPVNWIAMDLLSQAEHDELAQSILLSNNLEFINEIEKSINRLIKYQTRSEIIRKSLSNKGALILVKDLEQACSISNNIAPEHLEIATENPEKWLEKIYHAGAIFLGHFSPEVFGDYCAGPSHVLPTSSTARFSSPLSVYDFQKRSSVINISKQGAKKLGRIATELAESEGLKAHEESAKYRLDV
ncbi:MAG: histidinol dehydrogenase [Bordetella sp.]|nr:MAG: histidinol dehydrogenase [Bordetella sp.]